MNHLLFINDQWKFADEKNYATMSKFATMVAKPGDQKYAEVLEETRQKKLSGLKMPMVKFREHLINSGFYDEQIQEKIDALEDPKVRAHANNYWSRATEVRYNDTHLQHMRSVLGLNLDKIFGLV